MAARCGARAAGSNVSAARRLLLQRATAPTGNIQRHLLARDVPARMSVANGWATIWRTQMDKGYARLSGPLTDRPQPRVLRAVTNRPDRLNATDGEMHSDLTEIWRVIDADPSVSAVLLTGAGKAFSAGGDLDLLDKMIADVDT